MPFSTDSTGSLGLYKVFDKFGFFGYVMACSEREAKGIAIGYLPISQCRADLFVVERVSGIELVEI